MTRILILHVFLLLNKQAEALVLLGLHDLVYQFQQGPQWQTNYIVVCAFNSFYKD
jgi:hypothetical protein